MNKTLLIGNGINRTLNDKFSAENLIKALCKNVKIDERYEKSGKSFQLLFETIYNKYIMCGKTDDDIFSDIKNHLKELNLTDNDLLKGLEGFNKHYESIITTNYDFALEYNLLTTKKETRAIGKNRGYVSNNLIYHMHGCFQNKKGICLGQINYQKYLRSNISNVKRDLSKYKKTGEIYEALPVHLAKFLTNDIDILGISIDNSELLLWYILTLRATLITKGIIEKNTIRYYELITFRKTDDENIIMEQQKQLKVYYENMYIDYIYEIKRTKDTSNAFKSYYGKIIKELMD